MARAEAPSIIGDLATLQAGQVLLPSFVAKRGDGLYVDMSVLDSPGIFLHFVEGLFAAEACFADLDYELFLKCAFEYEPGDVAAMLEGFEREGRSPEVRIARDIVAFPAGRQEIYRGVKPSPDGKTASYLFEQVAVDIEIETPVHGEADENGERLVTHIEKTLVSERAYLDFDEFVVALWNKGVRYGIDADLVRAAIAADLVERQTIARHKEPMEGRDASIKELCDTLHRSDAPHILSDGRMDLRQFSNRFPQVKAGTQLVRKQRRVAGVSGWNVLGKEIAPNSVKDFDIEKLAGPGTRIERSEAGDELVVSTMEGFLNIDTKSSQLSVSEKIVSREGVSLRTTGDLSIAGDEFEEHGEVQEQRNIKGRHMTFHADVFGNVSSNGGRIVLKQGIAGGTANSPGGSITVEGSASRATLKAEQGVLEVAMAESCLLIGKIVHVGRAVRCDIVAEEVVIEHAEGCAIAAKNAKITKASPRKDEGTILSLLMPDVADYEEQIEKAAAERKKAEEAMTGRHKALTEITAQPEMKSYLALQQKLKAKTLVMTAEQERNWQNLLARLAPRLRDFARIHGEIKTLQGNIDERSGLIETLNQKRIDALSAVHCEIGEVEGETIVRSRHMGSDAPALASLPAKELHIVLRKAGSAAERIFFGESGSVRWPPEAEQPSDQPA